MTAAERRNREAQTKGVTTRLSRAARKPVGGKREWFNRRQWPIAPDGFSIVIPSRWDVPGAQALTITEPNAADQDLPAVPATVTQIATSGVELPSPLFRATGPRYGKPIGVAVGVYDIGTTNDLGSLRDALTEAVPDHLGINEVAVSRLTGLEVLRSPVEVPDMGGLLYRTDV